MEKHEYLYVVLVKKGRIPHMYSPFFIRFVLKYLFHFLSSSPRRQRHFHVNTDKAYSTLHFATQSHVPKGAMPHLDSATTKRCYAT